MSVFTRHSSHVDDSSNTSNPVENLVSGLLHFLVILIMSSRHVAEQVTKRHSGWSIRSSGSRTNQSQTVTSSPGEEEGTSTLQVEWSSQRRKGDQYVVLSRSWTQPQTPITNIIRWSQAVLRGKVRRVIAFLAVTDYQEFIPLLSAAASFRDFIGQRWCSFLCLVRSQLKTSRQKSDKVKAIDAGRAEVSRLKEKMEQKNSTLLKADFFLPIHFASRDLRRPKRHGQESDEDIKLRLRRSRWTGHVASSWPINSQGQQKNSTVTQADHATWWVEFTEGKGCPSAVPSLVGAPLKLWGSQWWKSHWHCQNDLSLQNVRGNLAQPLNVSINDTTKWTQAHTLLINYFNKSVSQDTRGIYQFSSSDKKRGGQRLQEGQKSRGLQKGEGSKDPHSESFKGQTTKGKSEGEGKTKVKGQWTPWPWNQNQSWHQNQSD